MTANQIQALAKLVSETDFISVLVTNRPPMTGFNSEQTVASANRAQGWEDCANYIIQICQPPQKPAGNAFVDVSKLDK